jgi:hypothetical protein
MLGFLDRHLKDVGRQQTWASQSGGAGPGGGNWSSFLVGA